MIDALANSVNGAMPFQWGPIIVVLLTASLAGFGWALKRIINRIDENANKLNRLDNRMVRVETKLGTTNAEKEERDYG